MSKYIHEFNTLQDRNDYVVSSAFTEPFVSTHGAGIVSYNKDADEVVDASLNGHDYVEIGGLK